MTVTQIYVGIGSNIDRGNNIRGGLLELKSLYGELEISPVYESQSFGFEGDDFFNLVAGFKTARSVGEVETQLRRIEFQFGRRYNATRYSSRTLDIDLLLYGDLVCDKHELPRIDVLKYGFVLKPLYDIAPELVHSVAGKKINELWHEFQSGQQRMEQLDYTFIL